MLFLINCEQTRQPFWTQLSHWQMFMQNGNTIPSDIFNSSAISHNFNLRSAKMSLEFFGVFQDKWQIWVTWAFSIICVCMSTFKVSIPPPNHCFQQSRVRITLIKLLLCLNSIFPIRKQCFINIKNSDFFIILKICNTSFT